MLSLKHGSSTQSPCHLRKIRFLELCKSKPISLQTLPAAKSVFEILSDPSRNIDGELIIHKYLMLTMFSASHTFPMVGIHPYVDIYAIRRTEPMQTLSLGVSEIGSKKGA